MPGPGILTQREIDELLGSMGSADLGKTESAIPKDKVKRYDFSRPNKLQHDELRGMAAIYSDFGKYVAMVLSNQLRTTCSCELLYIDEQTFYDYTNSIINTSVIGIMEIDPLEGAMAVELSSTLVNCMINLILGGNPDVTRKIAAYTEIELTLLQHVLSLFAVPLKNAWTNIVDIQPHIERIEVSGQHIQVASPNETVAIATFQVKIGQHEGTMNCCIPYSVVEPYTDKLNSRKKFRQQLTQKQEIGGIEGNVLVEKIDTVKVEIKCELGKSQLTMQEIDCLQVGDVVKLSKKVGEPVDILYNDVHKFTGEIGIKNNKYAVRIIDKFGRGGDKWQN
jgi:flagellar motor switch protein FliM